MAESLSRSARVGPSACTMLELVEARRSQRFAASSTSPLRGSAHCRLTSPPQKAGASSSVSIPRGPLCM
eukprot:2979121-Pyramimonas_sp.AAC.1